MSLITILSFILFTGLVALITWLITRKDNHQSSRGYFLAGRSLTFPLIAGSLLLTNLSTEQLVGLNGLAFNEGLSVIAWEVVAVLALVAMALFFLPRFLKSGIATLPQLLEIRFDKKTALITNFIFLLAYMIILMPIILYSGARGLSKMLDLSGILGIQDETLILWITVWFVGIVGSIYALWGGLRTVVVSDTLNGIGLLIGGMLIPYFAFNLISDGQGIMEGWRILKTTYPQALNSIGGPTQSVPFFTLFTGVMIINLFYWCTNQQIIQRTFGASSLAEGQKGVLLTGLLKLLGPLYLVFPGIIAFYLYSRSGVKADNAYGTLVRQVLPAPLTGFFAAVMVGAILSSFNSALNSTCTLFSLGFYKGMLKKNATDEQVVKSGKWFGLFLALGAMTIAPFLAKTESIYEYLQKMNGIYFIPIFAVVTVGLLSKRVPAKAAQVALISGVGIIAIGYFVPGCDMIVEYLHEYHFLAIVFIGLIAAMLIWAKLAPSEKVWVQQDVKAVDLTPWKWAVPVGILLCIIVCIIYYSFADFGVLY